MRTISQAEDLVDSQDPHHPANLICTLCKQFFNSNWCTGTGGGISIKHPDTGHLYVAPSGVQKEKMKPQDMFVLDGTTFEYLRVPKGLKPSACTPLFTACYKYKSAGAIVHTHSLNAVTCSLIFEKEFRIKGVEQIKAIPSSRKDPNTGKVLSLNWDDTCIIPIVENQPHEDQLRDPLLDAFEKYPHTCAVIVRRHGIFVWGPTIDKAKIFNEALDYLMELAIKMHQLGIPPDCDVGEESSYTSKH
ncbi:MDE1 (YJR024C) [Zygosaccharomyces parabailii]|uniref:Methylthioribulose-1-phosphate dehydratase n=1 Tax=Zygosaccharomyces bailii (strain CLIB 213 / ATCC 58445 / CBS 680 / BCRC 21525 / NBRC 1098 / NCYC 1416 / NRRL Y-2227) TaxID=1333698 RepID=A0A8J2X4V3_ZYGB2|nr:MDE1 (YJR024C) [Zygosaccharomyces parabailii]CDF87480.1 BN860_07316g1_1 [Zygosaccharomyces bailii CLIB 213]CDH09372.1 Methylthioribulose-1-phosphate dehydratase [Zygosaccharomyces bailii ISA1307]